MARLAAKEDALYYPTDVPVVRLFVEKHINFDGSSIVVFDPCVGEGMAVRAFTDALVKNKNKKIYGIELETNRASQAEKILDVVVSGAYEDMLIQNSPDVIFHNPPYDYVNGKRTELQWINMVAPLMERGTYMVLVLPEMFFEGGKHHDEFRMCLKRNNLTLQRDKDGLIGAFKFPDPYFEKFKQHIVVVERPYGFAKLLPKIHIEGVIGEVNRKVKLVSGSFNLRSEMSISKLDAFGYTSELVPANYEKLFGKIPDVIPVNPLQAMRPEILAAVIAGGMFNGIKIDKDTIVRGGTTITKHVEEVVNEELGTKETITTQRMVAHVSEMNIRTGELNKWDSSTPEFGDKIEVVAKILADIINVQKPSIFQQSDHDRLLPKISKVHAPRLIDGHANGLFPAQTEAALTILRGWETDKVVFLLGKMGIGKTIVSIAASVGQVINRKDDAQKIVILLPSKDDIVNKWEEEIHMSCRELEHKVFKVTTITEAKEAMESKGLTFILLKESMAKRTSGVSQISKKDKCWSCGLPNELVNKEGELIEDKNSNEYAFCSMCDASYQTFTRNHHGNAYASIATYILKRYAKSFVLIQDEAHQFKGGDSARGYASGALQKAANRILTMTGTFYNGYASSMYYLLYRASGRFRSTNTYEGVKDFVTLYGLEQVIEKSKKKDLKYSFSGYNIKKNTTTKEIPGIHPSMVGLMLPNTVFMKLEDLNISLPPQSEHTLFFDLPEKVAKETNSYLSQIKDEAVSRMKDGDMSLISKLTWTKAAVHDVYPMGDQVDDFSLSRIDNDKLAPKEEALLRIVSEEKGRGAPVLVYYIQTERRPIHHRLSNLFEERGMKIAYMPSTVKGRKAFINQALKDGADAIICNPGLVKEGIDLLNFLTIVWYGVTDDAILVNQANARNNRIGQTHTTRVFYFGYNKTYQAERWTVTAKKVSAMSAMHGDIRSGIAALLGDDSMISSIQDAIIDYEKYESSLTMADLPEIINYKEQPIIVEQVLAAPEIENYYEKLQLWKKEKSLAVAQPKKAKKYNNQNQSTLF